MSAGATQAPSPYPMLAGLRVERIIDAHCTAVLREAELAKLSAPTIKTIAKKPRRK